MSNLTFNISKDPVISVALTLMHATAITLLWLWGQLPIVLQIVCTLALLGSYIYYLVCYGGKWARHSVVKFHYDTLKGYQCQVGDNKHDVVIHWSSLATNWLVALDCIDSHDRRHYKILLWHCLHHHDDFTMLLKQLKLAAIAESPHSGAMKTKL